VLVVTHQSRSLSRDNRGVFVDRDTGSRVALDKRGKGTMADGAFHVEFGSRAAPMGVPHLPFHGERAWEAGVGASEPSFLFCSAPL
jgi:hypothetical protein